MSELVFRFVLGGTVVSVFACIGEMVKPKTLAGLFGAAPSVALATLGIAFAQGAADLVAVESRWFALACVAMMAYCTACVLLTRSTRIPEWLVATAAWLVWLAMAALVYELVHADAWAWHHICSATSHASH